MCGRSVSAIMKVYKTVARPATGSETKIQDAELEVAQSRMLRFSSEVRTESGMSIVERQRTGRTVSRQWCVFQGTDRARWRRLIRYGDPYRKQPKYFWRYRN
ncbi:Uncharacterised protein at_DN1447 [Pycnogonum litorale]